MITFDLGFELAMSCPGLAGSLELVVFIDDNEKVAVYNGPQRVEFKATGCTSRAELARSILKALVMMGAEVTHVSDHTDCEVCGKEVKVIAYFPAGLKLDPFDQAEKLALAKGFDPDAS